MENNSNPCLCWSKRKTEDRMNGVLQNEVSIDLDAYQLLRGPCTMIERILVHDSFVRLSVPFTKTLCLLKQILLEIIPMTIKFLKVGPIRNSDSRITG